MLYDIPAIRKTREFMVANPEMQMVGIVVGTRYYSVVVIAENKLELEKYAFQLDSEAASASSEKACD
jgi:hypothetical protein